MAETDPISSAESGLTATPASAAIAATSEDIKAADLPADHYPIRQQLLDRVTIALTRSLWLLSAWQSSNSWQDMVAALSVGLMAAVAYWVTGAVVKLVDDVVDDEDIDLPRAIRSGQIVPRSAIMVGLTALACLTAAAASRSPIAVVMMVAEVTGCLLAGKIDCWEHSVVMAVMWCSGVPTLWANPMLLVRAACLVLAAGADEVLKAWGKKHVDDEAAAGYRQDRWSSTWMGEVWSWVVTLSISRNVTLQLMVATCVLTGDWSHMVVLSFYGYEDASMWYTTACDWFGVCGEAAPTKDATGNPSPAIKDTDGMAA